jgi:hypothetical protein
MLVGAYQAAANGDYSELLRLEELFQHPYDEQDSLEGTYYRMYRGGPAGGITHMT